MSLAQGRGDGIFARVDAAAGESDLAGVGSHMLAPDGQDHARFWPIGDRDQHGRGIFGLIAQFGQVAIERRHRRLRRQGCAQAIGKAGHASPSGKKGPLQIPGG